MRIAIARTCANGVDPCGAVPPLGRVLGIATPQDDTFAAVIGARGGRVCPGPHSPAMDVDFPGDIAYQSGKPRYRRAAMGDSR